MSCRAAWLLVLTLASCVRLGYTEQQSTVTDSTPADSIRPGDLFTPADAQVADVSSGEEQAKDSTGAGDSAPPPDGATPPVDAATPLPDALSACLDKQAKFTPAVSCPVFYSCCVECGDSAGLWRIECTDVDCVCLLNGFNLVLCGTNTCKTAVESGCCAK